MAPQYNTYNCLPLVVQIRVINSSTLLQSCSDILIFTIVNHYLTLFRYFATRTPSCYHCRLLLSSCLRSSKSFFRLYPLSTPLHHCRPPWHSCGSSGNASSSNTLPSEPLALRFFFFHPGLLPLSVAPLALFGPLVLVNVRAACPVQSSWSRLLLVVWPLAYLGLLPLFTLHRSPLAICSLVASCLYLLRRLRYSGRLPLWSEPLAPRFGRLPF